MALNAYLTLKGAKQGPIKGSVVQKGREGWIAIYAVDHEITSPRDSASGQATGKRQHKPLSVTKEIDRSSPLLMNALISNEVMTEVVLRFFSPQRLGAGGGGAETNVYNITLTNASITSIYTDMLNNKMEPGIKMPVLEQLCFFYQKIEWTWTDGGILATDDWTNPGS